MIICREAWCMVAQSLNSRARIETFDTQIESEFEELVLVHEGETENRLITSMLQLNL